jgi:hypothetical protein
VARLTTKDAEAMKAKVLVEWDQTRDITAFFRQMEEAQSQAERWSIDVDRAGMTNHAVIQMQESGLYDRKFLREWETKEPHVKTWELMKQYFTEEYRAIQTFEPNRRNFETVNNLTESSSQDVSQFFKEFRRDAIVGSEQIQQMAQTFKGVTESMGSVIERLEAAMEENATLTKTVATLTATNKQLTESNKTLAEALKALGGRNTPDGAGEHGRRNITPATQRARNAISVESHTPNHSKMYVLNLKPTKTNVRRIGSPPCDGGRGH